jgi:hypothetical protein
VTSGICFHGTNVRPGQFVTCTITAVDPQGGPITWRVASGNQVPWMQLMNASNNSVSWGGSVQSMPPGTYHEYIEACNSQGLCTTIHPGDWRIN